MPSRKWRRRLKHKGRAAFTMNLTMMTLNRSDSLEWTEQCTICQSKKKRANFSSIIRRYAGKLELRRCGVIPPCLSTANLCDRIFNVQNKWFEKSKEPVDTALPQKLTKEIFVGPSDVKSKTKVSTNYLEHNMDSSEVSWSQIKLNYVGKASK